MKNRSFVAAKMYRRYKKNLNFQEFKEKGAFVPVAVKFQDHQKSKLKLC